MLVIRKKKQKGEFRLVPIRNVTGKTNTRLQTKGSKIFSNRSSKFISLATACLVNNNKKNIIIPEKILVDVISFELQLDQS